jgi:predicted transcriptional regulator
MARKALGWTAELLKRLHGVNYPITKETLKEKLAGMHIKGVPIEKVIEEIEEEQFNSPREVLHAVAEAVKKLEERGEIVEHTHKGIRWAAEVLKRLHGVDFPVNKETLKEKLKGLYWRGIPVEKLIDAMEVEEVKSPAELLHELSVAAKKLEEQGEVA